MLRCCTGLAAVIALSSVGFSISRADDPVAAKHYGAGVHDYYQGRYFEALRHLDQSIQRNGRDARAYFFRGLAKRRMGRADEARFDFLTGSQIEVALKSRNVGMALQRVQGPDRLSIERYRREARQLPEDVVKKVVPQPARSTVQRRAPRPPATVTRAESVVSDLADDESDPFRDSARGLLGRGEIEVAADPSTETPVPPAGDVDAFVEGFDEEEPFGSGVVAEAEADDPFTMDDDPASATETDSESASSGTGALGAAFRAFSRTVAPAAITEQGAKLLDSVRGSAAPGDEADDPFAVDTFGDDPVDAPDDFGATASDSMNDDSMNDDSMDDDSMDDDSMDDEAFDDPFAIDPVDDGQDADNRQDVDNGEDPDVEPADDPEAQDASTEDEQDPFSDDPFNFE